MFRLALVLIFSLGFVGGCSYLNQKFGMKDDNVMEEAIENEIKSRTGIDMDLSPDSPESALL